MRSSTVLLSWASSAALLASASSGCSFVVDFDRSRVGTDTGTSMDAGRDGGPPADDTGPGDAGSDTGTMMMDDTGTMMMGDTGTMMMDDAGRDAGTIPGDAGPCGGDLRVGMACDPANACETGVFVCNGGTVECMGSGTPRASTHVCRPAAGDCDLAENCDGVALTCPSDAFRPSGFECRAAAGDCDVPETCSGSTATCPTDVLVAASVECRASTGECDPAEVCSGASATCPSDAFSPMGTACTTPAMGQCSGSSAACGCATGFTPCSGVCVDTTTDAMNCGMCGMMCADPTPNCAGSTCVP